MLWENGCSVLFSAALQTRWMDRQIDGLLDGRMEIGRSMIYVSRNLKPLLCSELSDYARNYLESMRRHGRTNNAMTGHFCAAPALREVSSTWAALTIYFITTIYYTYIYIYYIIYILLYIYILPYIYTTIYIYIHYYILPLYLYIYRMGRERERGLRISRF